MKQSSLAKRLKFAIIGIGLCGLIVYAVVIPILGMQLRRQWNGEFSGLFWPWLVFLWATAIPCAAALVLSWRIASNIGADRSFSMENAGLLHGISVLIAADSAFFFLGNLIYWLLNLSHPGVVIAAFPVAFAGVAISVAAAALSHLVRKAAELQEQSDLTI